MKKLIGAIKQNFKEIGVFSLLVAFFAGLYGFIPGVQLPSLGIWYGTLGIAQALASQPFTHWMKCEDLLLPYGMPLIQGFLVTWSIAFQIKVFSIPADIAGNLTGIAFVIIALLSFSRILTILRSQRWIGYFCGCLFLLMPFIRRHLEYGSMGLGFMIVPVSLLADLVIVKGFFQKENLSIREQRILAAKVLGIRLLLVGVDWYSAVISIVGGGLMITYYSMVYIRIHRKFTIPFRAALVWTITWISGILPWYLALPGSHLSEPFSLDLFRAQGVDVISLLVPRGYYLWGLIVDLPTKWPAFEFYGDGTNVDYNYLGYSLLFALGMVAYQIFKRKNEAALLTPLIVAGAICFVFSLGPSLKIDSRRHSDKTDVSEITYQDYHMPADNAVMSLPTSVFYKVFPISYMRATYRWILFPKIILIVVLGWTINNCMRAQRKRWAFLLCGLVVLEFFPQYGVLANSTAENYKEYRQTGSALVDSMRPLIRSGDMILIISNPLEGDYLASWIVPNLRVKSFNGGGDKNNWLATPHMPEVIKRLKRYDVRNNDEIKDLVRLALQSEVVDKIVIPYFDSRWDSYDWPPDSDDVARARARFKFLEELQTDSLAIASSTYFSVLSSKVKRSSFQHDIAEQLDSVTQYLSTLPESTMILVDGAKAPLTSLFSGRGEFFYDFRQTEFVDAAFNHHEPVVFVLTGYQKYFDKENYSRLHRILDRNLLFQTTDYAVYSVSSFVYYYLNPGYAMTPKDCFNLARDFNTGRDANEVSSWSPVIDFTIGDYQRQLCRGWFPVERVQQRAYRWMSSSATAFLLVPETRPKRLVLNIYPPLNQLNGKLQSLKIYVNGYRLGERTLTRQDPIGMDMPLGSVIRPGDRVAVVTLQVDEAIAPSERDRRELGLIVSKLGLE